MNKEIADFTISLIAKKEGFNEKCIYVYSREGKLSNCSFSIEKGIIEFYPQNFNSDGYLYSQNVMCSAPTYIQLIDWVFAVSKLKENTFEWLRDWNSIFKGCPLEHEFKGRFLDWFSYKQKKH